MQKIVFTKGTTQTSVVTDNETPEEILKFFHVNPTTNYIYVNGKIITSEEIKKPFPKTSTVYITVKTKSSTRV